MASCRIWDSLGFKKIGRVKGCGNLRSFPDQLVDAIQYGRDLGPEAEDYAAEDRFDKIRYYLRHGKYPDGADRAEKSRLRSAATHYRLILGDGNEEDRLMLKGKEVVSDPARQLRIAKETHDQHHAGINKCTATITERYHWAGIKGTVNLAIRNCPECREQPRPFEQSQVSGRIPDTSHNLPSSAFLNMATDDSQRDEYIDSNLMSQFPMDNYEPYPYFAEHAEFENTTGVHISDGRS